MLSNDKKHREENVLYELHNMLFWLSTTVIASEYAYLLGAKEKQMTDKEEIDAMRALGDRAPLDDEGYPTSAWGYIGVPSPPWQEKVTNIKQPPHWPAKKECRPHTSSLWAVAGLVRNLFANNAQQIRASGNPAKNKCLDDVIAIVRGRSSPPAHAWGGMAEMSGLATLSRDGFLVPHPALVDGG